MEAADVTKDPDERRPCRFTYTDKNRKTIDISRDIYHDIYKSTKASTEAKITLDVAPQAVFRVRAVSRCASTISGHGEAILASQFSPSTSSRLVTGSGDATARIWDTETGTPYKTLKGHTSWVLAVAYAPDASMVATGSNDSTIRLWDPKSGEALGPPLKAHKFRVNSLSFEPYHLQTPGRPRLASASKDATIRVWDAVNKKVDFTLSGHKSEVTCVKWGGSGKIYSASRDRTIKIWLTTGSLAHTLTSHGHWVNHLALSTDLVLRTGYFDHTGEVPPTEEAKIAKAKARFEKAATVEGRVIERLVSASDDFTIFLWEPPSASTSAKFEPLARLHGHQKGVNHVTFSPDGSLIASSGFDNNIKLWRASTGEFITTLRGHVAPIYISCFSADSRLLVSGSKDTTLKVWDIKTGKLKQDLPGHQAEVFALDWSPDGERVGSGGKDKAVRIWRN